MHEQQTKYLEATQSSSSSISELSIILDQQVKIAEEVIRQIQAIGGRFLKEDDEGAEGWYEVDQDRAVEKTCQALREKDKAKTPTGDPFTDPNKKTSLGPFPKSRSKKKRKLDDSDDDDDEDDEDEDDSDDGDSFSQQDSTEQNKTSKETSKTPEKAKAPIDISNIIQQIRSYDEHEMLKRLNQFKTVYGHAGVPPGWPRDVRLADWCSAQRQVYREITAAKSSSSAENDKNDLSGGYRKPSDAEDDLIKELDDMDFVWNYEEWHWKDRYEQLMAVEHGDLEPSTAAFTRKALVRWLNHEREQVRLGDTVLTKEQMEDLKRAGICL